MPVTPESLCVHILNVGNGDSIVIQFPKTADGDRKYAVVDCYSSDKTLDYLEKMEVNDLEFLCATHPHYDHTAGIPKILTKFKGHIQEYWDSGFRFTSNTAKKITGLIEADPLICFMRVTSGMERVINNVKVTVLAPSISLRNRYDTYGVDVNNASIVLRLEYTAAGSKTPSTIILGGDAEWPSWSRVLEEFPHMTKTQDQDQRVQVTETFNPLNCQVLKVSHHGSKHGTALECIEVLDPEYAVFSCGDPSDKDDLPHELAMRSVKEIFRNKAATDRMFFTNYSYEGKSRSGSIVVISKGIGAPEIIPLEDDPDEMANPPKEP